MTPPNSPTPKTPMAPPPLNNEQLEAELEQGLGVTVDIEVSRTALAHLIWAAQLALDHPLHSGSAALYRDFINDAQRRGRFTGETAKLIEQRKLKS